MIASEMIGNCSSESELWFSINMSACSSGLATDSFASGWLSVLDKYFEHSSKKKNDENYSWFVINIDISKE